MDRIALVTRPGWICQLGVRVTFPECEKCLEILGMFDQEGLGALQNMAVDGNLD